MNWEKAGFRRANIAVGFVAVTLLVTLFGAFTPELWDWLDFSGSDLRNPLRWYRLVTFVLPEAGFLSWSINALIIVGAASALEHRYGRRALIIAAGVGVLATVVGVTIAYGEEQRVIGSVPIASSLLGMVLAFAVRLRGRAGWGVNLLGIYAGISLAGAVYFATSGPFTWALLAGLVVGATRPIAG